VWESKLMHGDEAQWAEWMQAANAGDSRAYRLMLEALTPFLRKLARQGFARAGLSGADVEDVVQETLLAIHLKRQTWDADQLFTPWVRAIARNKLIDNLRRRGNRTELPIEDFVEVLPAEPAAEEMSPVEATRLLSILGGRQREIVQAICMEGASIKEASAKFGISEGATRVALHRGLGALAAAYRSGEK
jgi:RNA polymerase sigma-70 factor (ECF subfamily)